jgi:nucleoside 2-deoxyribosyltransferase
MRIYIASRYDRRPEMAIWKDILERAGFETTSRWVMNHSESSNEEDLDRYADEDEEDIDKADAIMAFTEIPFSVPSTGGRHYELGYAKKAGKQIFIIGPREHVFIRKSKMMIFKNLAEFLSWYIRR